MTANSGLKPHNLHVVVEQDQFLGRFVDYFVAVKQDGCLADVDCAFVFSEHYLIYNYGGIHANFQLAATLRAFTYIGTLAQYRRAVSALAEAASTRVAAILSA